MKFQIQNTENSPVCVLLQVHVPAMATTQFDLEEVLKNDDNCRMLMDGGMLSLQEVAPDEPEEAQETEVTEEKPAPKAKTTAKK